MTGLPPLPSPHIPLCGNCCCILFQHWHLYSCHVRIIAVCSLIRWVVCWLLGCIILKELLKFSSLYGTWGWLFTGERWKTIKGSWSCSQRTTSQHCWNEHGATACLPFTSVLIRFYFLFLPLSQIPVAKKSFWQNHPEEIRPAIWRFAPQM